MEKRMGKINWRLILLLTSLGIIGILALIPYGLATLNTDLIPEEIAMSPFVIVLVNSISQVIMLFIFVFIGVLLLHRTRLGVPILDAWVHGEKIPPISKKWIILGVVVSFFGSFITLTLDKFVFIPQLTLPEQVDNIAWWHGLLAMFYGGITEELMVRLFGMTLVVWLLAIITRKQSENIPKVYYYIGIIVAVIGFGLGHLPVTIQLFGELTTVILVRALVLNGLLGLWFGYLFYKKGLEYAMIAHMSADIFLHVLLNPLFN